MRRLALAAVLLAGCGAQTDEAIAYGVLAGECAALRQAILDRHGDDLTAEDEADYVHTREVCSWLLGRLETSGGEQ